jgi:hypothetical protein
MEASPAPVFNGPLRVSAANPRYFSDDAGSAIYLTGSHTWAVLQDMWLEGAPRKPTDYAGFLRMMEDNGHNFLRFWSWMQTRNANWSETPTHFDPQPFARSGPGLANDGLPRFDLARWNDDYFARLRERVEQAGRKGIYVSVMLFEAWAIKWATPATDPWPFHPMHPANNINGITDDPVAANGRAWDFYSLRCPQLLEWQKAYVREVVDTLNDLDNVLFEICNEVPHRPEAMAWQDHMCLFIKQYERGKPKQHPVGITAEGGDQDNAELFASSADWISPSNGRLFEYRYNPPAADGSKVILNDTDHLWGHGCEVGWIWKSFARGMNVLFMDPWEPIPSDMPGWVQNGVSLNQRYYHLWDAVRRNLGYARRFAQRMDLNRCAPHDALCTSGYCLAAPGREYLCFFPAGGREGLDLWDAPGQFSVEWFSPTTGETSYGETISGNKRHALAAPFTGSAVLYLRQTT